MFEPQARSPGPVESFLILVSLLTPGVAMLCYVAAAGRWFQIWIRANVELYLGSSLVFAALVALGCSFFAAGILAARIDPLMRPRQLVRWAILFFVLQIALTPGVAMIGSMVFLGR
ncbi:hypothetical protein [Luteolibacter luteus]|uniref:Uncharacterized protein n=1 Tax=Luteolibacter luteus TaxID=2728835 RepID=A0A858RKA4_9BACT|nr:hypothetical protein [Luteolibacter luteus]QJE96630.1 hypothetical protein HHL09_12820 [Luteolibacter luteus]